MAIDLRDLFSKKKRSKLPSVLDIAGVPSRTSTIGRSETRRVKIPFSSTESNPEGRDVALPRFLDRAITRATKGFQEPQDPISRFIRGESDTAKSLRKFTTPESSEEALRQGSFPITNEKGEVTTAVDIMDTISPISAVGGVTRRVGKGMARNFADKVQSYLPKAQNQFEDFAHKYVTSNAGEALAKYKNRVNEIFGTSRGHVISADEAKYIIPEFDATRSGDYHEAASALSKAYTREVLSNPETKDLPGLIMAGGSGAGKTTALAGTGFKVDNYAIVYDTNLNNMKSATRRINETLKTGRPVHIRYVYRDPVEAFTNGVIPRVRSKGRIVPVESHLNTHIDSNNLIRQLTDKYKGEQVDIAIIDNSRGRGNQEVIGIDKLPVIGQDKNRLRKEIYGELTKAFEEGKITAEEFRTFASQTDPKILRSITGADQRNVSELLEAGDSARRLEPELNIDNLLATKPTAGVIDNLIGNRQATVQDQLQNLNLSKIENADELFESFEALGKRYKDVFEQARGGVISHEETIEAARKLGVNNPEKMIRKNPDDFPARVFALQEMAASKAKNIESLKQKLADPAQATDLIRLQLQAEMAELAAITSASIKNTAAAGRALNILRATRQASITPTQESIRKAMKFAEDQGLDLKTIANQIATLDSPEDIYKYARNLYKPKLGDMWRELFYNSLLSAPSTQIVNIVGNTIHTAFLPVEQFVSAAVDPVVSVVKRREQQRFAGEAFQSILGMRQGVMEGTRKILHTMKHGFSPDDIVKFELHHLPSIPTKLGSLIRTPGNLLKSADLLFKAVNHSAGMYSGAYRRAVKEGLSGQALKDRMADLLNNPTEELLEEAGKLAEYRLFQQKLGHLGKSVEKARKWSIGKNIRPLEFVLPFVRTPANIAKTGIAWTPAGMIRVAIDKGGEDSDMLAKSIIGSSIMAALSFKVAEGQITGAPPKDPAERDAFYRQGKMPYSMKIGDKWYSYQRWEPFNIPITAVAIMKDEMEQNPDANIGDAINRAVWEVGRNLASATYLSGISDLLDVIEDPDRYADQFLANRVRSIVPATSLLGAAARIKDPIIRDPQNPIESMQAGIPGLSEKIRPRYNALGQPIKREGGWIQQIVPFKSSPSKMDKLEKQLADLGDPVGFPSKSSKGFTWDEATHGDVIAIAGPKIREDINKLMERRSWDYMDEERKLDAVERVVERHRDAARMKMLPVALSNHYQVPVQFGPLEGNPDILGAPNIDARRLDRLWSRLRNSKNFQDASLIEQQDMVRALFKDVTRDRSGVDFRL